MNKLDAIPELEPHCGSWTVLDRATCDPVLVTFHRRTAEKINQDRYVVLTTLQALVHRNARIKANGGWEPEPCKFNPESIT